MDGEECYGTFLSLYTASCDAHIPKTTAPIRTSRTPWMTDEVRAASARKGELYRMVRAAGK